MSRGSGEALAEVLRDIEAWLQEPRAYPVAPAAREAVAAALHACRLGQEAPDAPAVEPVLLVLLVGGSGTGKSTLFNAFAGERLAPVGLKRPTTTAPIAYVHAELAERRLTAYPPLQRLQIVRHHRPGLRQKILVDTPDLDTRQAVREHRQAVLDLLPYGDLVLVVMSPEKYLDRAAWELLLPQMSYRGLAFVLTKGDLVPGDGGVPLQADVRALLAAMGYEQPRLYGVKAEQWVAYRTGERRTPPLGDDFLALERWLKDELGGEDIAALHADLRRRQLERLRQTLAAARPPDLEPALAALHAAWEQSLRQAAAALDTAVQAAVRTVLSPLQMEVVMEMHRQFRGLLGVYLSLADLLRYGPVLLLQRLRQEPAGVARVLERAMAALQHEPTRQTWRDLHLTLRHHTGVLTQEQAGAVPLRWISDRLAALEQQGPAFLQQVLPTLLAELCVPPVSSRRLVRVVQQALKGLFEALPVLFVLLCGYQLVLRFWGGQYLGGAFFLHAGALLLLLCLLLQGGIALVFPLTWPRRHRHFTRRLSERLTRLLSQRYLAVLEDFAHALRQEQQRLSGLCTRLPAVQRAPWAQPPASLQGVLRPPDDA